MVQNMSCKIYMDHAATTEMLPQVRKAMEPYLMEEYGNASTSYEMGRRTREALEGAREQIAMLIKAKPEEIFFTSGGSESDNWVIKNVAAEKKEKGKHVITSKIEHHAVLRSCEYLEKLGYELTYLDVDAYGVIDLAQLREVLREDTTLVSVMTGNNEIGTIEPLDAVASMLYLDYGKTPGNWVPNKYGGNGNLEAMEFFKHLNSIMGQRNPRAMVIAEESTSWPGVTKPAEEDGLGFTFKWNMGWMHDFLEYVKLDPYFRKYNHNRLTFGMTYAYSEKFILVLSHDEVVHLKCSMLGKMPGEYEDKFANLKVAYTFMIGHPGKKLLFMGQDFGQLSEWSEKHSLDWHLLNEPEHKGVSDYFKALLHLYRKYPACYELDQYPEGFYWINPNDGDRSIYSFVRCSENGKDNLLFVCSFTPVARPDYMVGVPHGGKYTLILDNEMKGQSTYTAIHTECDGQPYAVKYPLPAYGTAVFKFSKPHKKAKQPNKNADK